VKLSVAEAVDQTVVDHRIQTALGRNTRTTGKILRPVRRDGYPQEVIVERGIRHTAAHAVRRDDPEERLREFVVEVPAVTVGIKGGHDLPAALRGKDRARGVSGEQVQALAGRHDGDGRAELGHEARYLRPGGEIVLRVTGGGTHGARAIDGTDCKRPGRGHDGYRGAGRAGKVNGDLGPGSHQAGLHVGAGAPDGAGVVGGKQREVIAPRHDGDRAARHAGESIGDVRPRKKCKCHGILLKPRPQCQCEEIGAARPYADTRSASSVNFRTA
jgi:hypothetical protein